MIFCCSVERPDESVQLSCFPKLPLDTALPVSRKQDSITLNSRKCMKLYVLTHYNDTSMYCRVRLAGILMILQRIVELD